MLNSELSVDDLADLQQAQRLLENPSWAARLANLAGVPIEKGLDLLPQSAKDVIVVATNKALSTSLNVAVSTMTLDQQESSNRFHTLAVMASGAVGGAFGLPALVFELPISTTMMLRSIADIARSEGEPIGDVETKLACLEVFALGGRGKGDDSSETGYFAVRAALARALAEAAQYIAERSVVQEAAPSLVRFLAQIGTRFGIQVSEKAMAQALPIIGAAGGAVVNAMFIDHFQTVARGHFIVRRLERKYGKVLVEAKYKLLTTS